MRAYFLAACVLTATTAFPVPRKPVVGPRAVQSLERASVRLLHLKMGQTVLHPYQRGQSVPVVSDLGLEIRHIGSKRVICLLDGGTTITNATCNDSCICEWQATRGFHAMAAYAVEDGAAQLLSSSGVPEVVFLENDGVRRSLRRVAKGTPRVGVYFTTISDAGQSYWRNFSRGQGVRAAATVEDALRSRMRFQDMVADAALAPAALFPINHTDWPQATPAVSDPSVSPFYGFYRPRPGEQPILPANPNISYHAHRQAALLTLAGVDFILQDASNFGPWDPSKPYGGDPVGDYRQMRPFEVLLEEWAALRSGGTSTPQVGVFNRLSPGDGMWSRYLDILYANASLEGLVAELPEGGAGGPERKVFSVVSRTDLNETALKLVQSDKGQHDVITPLQWLSKDVNGSDTSRGLWTYFQPCRAEAEGTNKTLFTSTVWPAGPACNHARTTNSSAGSVWTVSMAQVLGDLPFANPGKVRGAFFKMQMADVLAGQSSDVLYSPSWNENSITPIPMSQWDMTNPFFVAAGSREDDDYRHTIWLDGYGVDRSRFFEPMEQDGGLYYGVYASCLRVLRLQAALQAEGETLVAPARSNNTASVPGVAPPCSVAGEECCQFSAEELVVPVWSVENTETGDRALVATSADLQGFKRKGYTEVCNPYGANVNSNGGPTVFCADSQMPWCDVSQNGTDTCYRAARGPLMLQSVAGDGFGTALYRCALPGGTFNRLDTACRVGETASLLGFAWERPGSAAPRLLRRCEGQPTVEGGVKEPVAAAADASLSYHAIDNLCIDGSAGTVLGWVL